LVGWGGECGMSCRLNVIGIVTTNEVGTWVQRMVKIMF